MAETYFIRYAKERDYTVLNNSFLKDDKLSWKAKGLFAYILSLPDDWKIYLSELQSHSTDKETSVRTAIKELTERGYIIQKRVKDDKGRFDSYAYEIIENPMDSSFEPYAGFPHVEKPAVEKPHVENHALLNTHNTKYSNKPNTLKSSKDDLPLSSIIETNKKTKTSKDIGTMRSMINAFTMNEDIRERLLEYFNIRLKKGLQPNQWKIILDELRLFAGDNATIAIDKINNAIAGGYMQIIAQWEKDKKTNFSKPKFDNTAGRTTKAVVNMDQDEKQEFEDNLATDENGNLLQF